jgi:hypothetical protein
VAGVTDTTRQRSEASIQRAILLDSECQRVAVLWRNHVGRVTAQGRTHTFGLCVGSADIVGIHRVSGRFVAIEAKTSTGRVSPEQDMFLRLVARCGGLCGVARSVDDARAILRGERNDR